MLTEPKREKGYAIVTIPYERLDFSNVNGFKNGILDLIDHGDNRIIFEMGNIGFMDSKGLSAFLFLYRAVGTDGVLALVNMHEQIRKIFSLTRTDRVLPIFDSLQDALTSLGS